MKDETSILWCHIKLVIFFLFFFFNQYVFYLVLGVCQASLQAPEHSSEQDTRESCPHGAYVLQGPVSVV